MEIKKEVKDIKKSLGQAIHKLSTGYQGSSLTDIFVQADTLTGELSVIDDEDNLITKDIVPHWEDSDDEELDPESVLNTIKIAIEQLNDEGYFEELDVYKPFSVSFVDADMNVIEELLTLEHDSMLRIDDDIMEKLDKDFDAFLDRLMKE